jgi:hypothetical protein
MRKEASKKQKKRQCGAKGWNKQPKIFAAQ